MHGVQGHIAYPQFADNPVHSFAPALAELASRVWDQGNEHFQPTSFQVSNLTAGTGAPNVIPGELKARFNLRYSPVQTLDDAQAHGRGGPAAPPGAGTRSSGTCRASPSTRRPARCSAAVSAAVRTVTGCGAGSSRPAGGTSDGRFIAPIGAQVVELGVVNASIHKVNECVRVADIERCMPFICRRCATCWPSRRVAATRFRRGRAERREMARSASTQAISTQAGIVRPSKRQVTRAHSPEPVSTLRITSVSGNTSSM